MIVEISQGQVSLSRDSSRRLHISLCLEDGDLALLVGPNGSGKTTLLDVIAGLRPLDTGSIEYASPTDPIAYAVQDSTSGLLPWRSIEDNVLMPARLKNAVSNELIKRSERLLSSFSLGGRLKDFPYKMSGGEKQAVNLIRTLCTPCSLALIDEVLASLHRDMRVVARNELVSWLESRTAILVTHDPDDLNLPFSRFFAINHEHLEEVDRTHAERVLRDDE